MVRPLSMSTFYYVYILRSTKENFIYTGYSANLQQRLKQHNTGKVDSTKCFAPLELIHYEAYRSIHDAKRRELYFKTTKGKTTLRTMLRVFLTPS